MINMLLGSPGGGKSYEAVVYHVLNAIMAGRKVITNLPLNLQEFEKIEPGSSRLLDLRHPSPDNLRPFSTMQDYGEPWRGENGQGPLYVIDECHMVLPRGIGTKGTPREVEEWYSMHRHEGADVLLLTQSYRKVAANIVDLVQIVYRVRKNVALGSMNSYTRKVQDGIRGAVLNETVRNYKKRYFPLYQSHTLTNGAVTEAMTKDIRPIWKHWTFITAAIFIPVALVMLFKAGNPMEVKTPSKFKPKPVSTIKPAVYTPAPSDQPAIAQTVTATSRVQPVKPAPPMHPYSGYGIHVLGYLEAQDKATYYLGMSQNGQMIFMQTDKELKKAGYELEPVNDCAAKLTYNDFEQYILCDAPKQTVQRASRGATVVKRDEEDVPVTRLSEQQ